MSEIPGRADMLCPTSNSQFVPILLKKPKIERLQKSRQSRCEFDKKSAGMKTPADFLSKLPPYLSAACPASDTTLSSEPEPPLTPIAPITFPLTTSGLPPRDAITSSC